MINFKNLYTIFIINFFINIVIISSTVTLERQSHKFIKIKIKQIILSILV